MKKKIGQIEDFAWWSMCAGASTILAIACIKDLLKTDFAKWVMSK